jgi:4-amino-4-deoxy-L-arabinose transferase-like glycosyltransferase
MIAAAFLLLAMGIILRISNGRASFSIFLLLGVILGFGYLARTPLFFIGLLLLAVLYFSIRKMDKAPMLVFVAAITFLCISGPFIFTISKSKGRFTIGESGRLNYIWKVNKVPHFYHYQGAPNRDKPIHPSRKIFDDPPIYEFGTPIGGTYPPWYDPTYWYEGVKVHINFRQQLSRLVVSAKIYLSAIFDTHVPYTLYMYYGPDVLIACYLILLFMSERARFVFRDLLERKIILLPAVAGLAMYALVWLNPRYIAVYFVLLWVGVFSSLRLSNSKENRRLSASVCYAAFLVMFMTLAVPLTFSFYSDVRELMIGNSGFVHAQVAEGLKKMGLEPGTKIATIGYAFGDYSFFARLARLKIVSEIDSDDEDRFWHADSSVRAQVYRKFAETSAKVVVSKDIPPLILADGWERIENTNYYVYILSRPISLR